MGKTRKIIKRILPARLRFIVESQLTKRIGHRDHALMQDPWFVALWRQMEKDGRTGQTFHDVGSLYQMARLSVPGSWAEVGCYRGGTAWMLNRIKGNRILYVYDTFEGLPCDDGEMVKGDYLASEQDVRDYLSPLWNCQIIKGVFPESVIEDVFGFVHLDVDTYQSTMDCLHWFWPRMNPGGILVSHDYSTPQCAGVKLAFDEFFKDTATTVIPLWDTPCVVVKEATPYNEQD